MKEQRNDSENIWLDQYKQVKHVSISAEISQEIRLVGTAIFNGILSTFTSYFHHRELTFEAGNLCPNCSLSNGQIFFADLLPRTLQKQSPKV